MDSEERSSKLYLYSRYGSKDKKTNLYDSQLLVTIDIEIERKHSSQFGKLFNKDINFEMGVLCELRHQEYNNGRLQYCDVQSVNEAARKDGLNGLRCAALEDLISFFEGVRAKSEAYERTLAILRIMNNDIDDIICIYLPRGVYPFFDNTEEIDRINKAIDLIDIVRDHLIYEETVDEDIKILGDALDLLYDVYE